MRDLSTLCDTDRPRAATYDRTINRVLDATTNDAPVGLAMYGHPVVGQHIGHQLRTRFENRPERLAITGAASFLDPRWWQRGVDPFHGIQMGGAVRFVQRSIPPCTEAHLLLVQVDRFDVSTGFDGSNGVNGDPGTVADLSPLEECLKRYDPSDHTLTVVSAPSSEGPGGESRSFPLSQLNEQRHRRTDPLFLPRIT